jgi:small-conductance mechanosensitive channel
LRRAARKGAPGVIGIAIGARKLVSDVISGFFFLMEVS